MPSLSKQPPERCLVWETCCFEVYVRLKGDESGPCRVVEHAVYFPLVEPQFCKPALNPTDRLAVKEGFTLPVLDLDPDRFSLQPVRAELCDHRIDHRVQAVIGMSGAMVLDDVEQQFQGLKG